MRIDTLNMRALRTAALFASTDQTRPILTGVQVYDAELYVATDSYVLGMVSAEPMSPAALLSRVDAAGRAYKDSDDDHPLIPAKLIEQAAKRRLVPNTSMRLNVADGLARFEHHHDLRPDEPLSTDADRTIFGQYLNVHSLIALGDLSPQAVRDIGMQHKYLTLVAKAAATLADDKKNTTPVIFNGGSADNRGKPVWWSYRCDHGTLVVLLMPVKHEQAWA